MFDVSLRRLVNEHTDAALSAQQAVPLLKNFQARQEAAERAKKALFDRLASMQETFERIEVKDLLLDDPGLDGSGNGATPPDGDDYNDLLGLVRTAFSQLQVFDNTQAITEGWAIFQCSGSADGPWQLQADAEAGLLADDAVAWRFVVLKAREHSTYHLRALAWLRRHNPAEFDRILKFVKEEPHAPANT